MATPPTNPPPSGSGPPQGPKGPTRAIQCYHCQHRWDVAARAMSVSCPKCYKPVVIEDVVIKSAHAVRKVQTCGKVIVEPKGRLIAATIEASGGVECMGILEGNVTTPGRVVIGAKAQWKGDCRAASLKVELGAIISKGYFEVPGAAGADGVGGGVAGGGGAAKAAS